MRAQRDFSVLLLTLVFLFAHDGFAGAGKEKLNISTPPPAQARHAAPPAVAAPTPAEVRAGSASELVYGEPIRFHNMTLVPVGTTRKGPFQKYTLIEQGLKDQSLAVREMSGDTGQAQVNQVEVRNRGHQPVYLLGGEMILGGKQDRIIQQDTVLPGTGEWTKVAVFCVEHGRWQGQTMQFSSAGAVAHVSLRTAAMSGSQSAVWEEVAKNNLRHGTQSQTETYRRTVQNEALRGKIEPYRKQLTGMMPKNLTLSGFVFAINGDIRVADLFGNPVLFADLQDKLISSYILEALGQQENPSAPAVSKNAAQTFIGKARAEKKDGGKSSGRAMNYKMENNDLIGTETFDAQAGSVRETYIKK